MMTMTDTTNNGILDSLRSRWEEDKLSESRLNNRKMAGYFCPYFPEELVLAAGMVPVRLDAWVGKHPAVDCVCLMGECEETGYDGKSFSAPVFNLDLPPADRFRRDADAQRNFEKQLRELRRNLSGISGRMITYVDDMRAITLCNHIREILRRLYDSHAIERSPLEWLQVFEITTAGASMDRRKFLDELVKIEKALRLRGVVGAPADHRVRLMVTGDNLKGIERLNSILNEAGANIVADYACQAGMLLRKRLPLFGIAERPMESMSERCLYNAPCRHRGDDRARLDRMIRIARNYRVQGLVYFNPGNRDLSEDYKMVDSAFYRELSVPAALVSGDDLENMETPHRIKEYIDIIGGRI